ncbi:baseplate J/gp47 family protein [Paenibacillus sp. NEAU-GSW1]|uniref:baseplate J/gp47 family protein n=1 Tax=Paenibacillus sp. NEAU-GSW1 TaxID=2682486 RepID=UPI001C12B4BB|nr:baseplate J/gp47 family protein [Paenibacillus sp. NEAU-GSW1]
MKRPPNINSNNASSFVSRMKELAPFYTPEWRFSPEDPDAGTGLAYLAGDMLQDTVQRLNQAPINHFLSFLDLIQVKLQPPRPARANVVFSLSEGAAEPVHLPAGLMLTASHPDGGEPLVFESERALAATPAKVMEWINVHPERDRIAIAAEHYSEQNTAGTAPPIRLFDTDHYRNEQEHVLYLRHDELFLADRPCRFYLHIEHSEKRYAEPEIAAALASNAVEWSYPSGGRWTRFDSVTAAGNMIILHKQKPGFIEETEHQHILGRWIRCTLKPLADAASPLLRANLELDRVRVRASHDREGDAQGILPTDLFYNETELLRDGFFPFGEHFVPYSVFYLSSEETFTKRESRMRLHFAAKAIASRIRMAPDPEVQWKMVMRTSEFEEKDPPRVRIRKVQWEYWDGANWAALPGGEMYSQMFEDLPEHQAKSFTLEFICPENMAKTFVNGKFDFWIRARVIQVDPIIASVVEYMPPWLSSPAFSYAQGSQTLMLPDSAYTRSNADDRDRSAAVRQGGQPFRLFEPIPCPQPAVYAAFDIAPVKGPLGMHVALDRRFASGGEPPWIEWEALCYEQGRYVWLPLKMNDGTQSFTFSGFLNWAGPANMALVRLFGRERYWLRAVNRDSQIGGLKEGHPIAGRIDMNAVPVRQHISLEREMAVAANGSVQLTPGAFIEEEVWVDEKERFTEFERETLLARSEGYMAQRDGEGVLQRFWVRWNQVTSLAESGPDDRHYTAEYANGNLQFGDGVCGMLPSVDGTDLVRIRFKTTEGARGNVPSGSITGMQLPYAFISGVANPEPSAGGGDSEKIEQAMARGPQMLKHRGRAVTAKDVEWLAREAYPQIAKVKCISNRNGLMERAPGSLAIVAFPAGGLADAAQFPELRTTVERKLRQQASSLVALGGALSVIEPAYLEVSVHATIAVHSIDEMLPAEAACTAKLNQFLDPIAGNADGRGWNIGEALHPSLIHSLLHSVRYLAYIERLYLHVVRIENGNRQEWDPGKMSDIAHGIIVNGQHTITAIPSPN